MKQKQLRYSDIVRFTCAPGEHERVKDQNYPAGEGYSQSQGCPLSYGEFAQASSIKIGSQTLAAYTYTDDQNRYLKSLDYGNGDSVKYTYDDQGRLTKQTYENGDTISFTSRYMTIHRYTSAPLEIHGLIHAKLSIKGVTYEKSI